MMTSMVFILLMLFLNIGYKERGKYVECSISFLFSMKTYSFKTRDLFPSNKNTLPPVDYSFQNASLTSEGSNLSQLNRF